MFGGAERQSIKFSMSIWDGAQDKRILDAVTKECDITPKDSPGVAPEGDFTVQTIEDLNLTVADLLISGRFMT